AVRDGAVDIHEQDLDRFGALGQRGWNFGLGLAAVGQGCSFVGRNYRANGGREGENIQTTRRNGDEPGGEDRGRIRGVALDGVAASQIYQVPDLVEQGFAVERLLEKRGRVFQCVQPAAPSEILVVSGHEQNVQRGPHFRQGRG